MVKNDNSCLELLMSYCHCKLGVCRNFIWSMTSWKRGHTCQQHSTTTQPSRPSKARPVQGLQLFLRVNTVIQEERCGSHTLVFIPQGFGSLTAGVVATINTALPFQKVTCCPKTPTLLLLFSTFLFFLFFCLFFCAGSVMFTSLESKAFLLADGRMVTWQGLHLIFTCVDKRQKARRSEHPQIQVKGWKKCNVYCCTIFSNKRTQNLFAIVFIWTLPDAVFSPLFYPVLGRGCHATLSHASPFFLLALLLLHPSSTCIDMYLYLHHQPISVLYLLLICLSEFCASWMWTHLRDSAGLHKRGQILEEAK